MRSALLPITLRRVVTGGQSTEALAGDCRSALRNIPEEGRCDGLYVINCAEMCALG
jgi:hypothetical protein